MRALVLLFLFFFLAACGTSPAPQTAPQNVEVKDASAPPVAVTSASSASAPSNAPPPSDAPRRNGPTLKATAARKKEGTLDATEIVAAANADATGLQQCAVPLVSNHPGTGSVNLEITVTANGGVTGDLQSPAHPDAKKCILDLVRTWKVPGSGKAMVLLSVQH